MTYSDQTLQLAEIIEETCIKCKRCMKDCVFLQEYCEDPQELFSRFLMEDLEPIIPFSCTLCEHCTVVCPLDLKLAEVFLAMRQDLMKDGLPLKQLKSVEMHQFLSASKLFTATNRGDK